jgi:hypothetical protein
LEGLDGDTVEVEIMALMTIPTGVEAPSLVDSTILDKMRRRS